MAIECGKSVHVTDLHAVAIVSKRFRHHHHTGKDGPDGIVRETLDIGAGMMSTTTPAIRADDGRRAQQVAPVAICEISQMNGELLTTTKGVVNRTSRYNGPKGGPLHREVSLKREWGKALEGIEVNHRRPIAWGLQRRLSQ